jgi:hypothetical protein
MEQAHFGIIALGGFLFPPTVGLHSLHHLHHSPLIPFLHL